jgi:hypothetical protein
MEMVLVVTQVHGSTEASKEVIDVEKKLKQLRRSR